MTLEICPYTNCPILKYHKRLSGSKPLDIIHVYPTGGYFCLAKEMIESSAEHKFIEPAESKDRPITLYKHNKLIHASSPCSHITLLNKINDIWSRI